MSDKTISIEFTTNLTPREIVERLDRYIVGQDDAKRSVAIAVRNRWRRQQLDEDMRSEVAPKNILMIGPTSVGKNRDCPPSREVDRRAFHQSRSDQVTPKSVTTAAMWRVWSANWSKTPSP